jgi:spore photoproduct lyase
MISYRPKQILIQEQCWNDTSTRAILQRLQGIPTQTLKSVDLLTEPAAIAVPRTHARDTLILTRYPGSFLKPCQGAGAEICCNYYIVSYAWNCHLDCTYCVLQSYLSSDALVVCTNIEDLLREVNETLNRAPDRMFRIGTGELADSLALDPITCYSQQLVPFWGTLPNGVLELKTKSNRIANLEGLDHRGHTVVSWSVNSRHICRTEERKAASFEERLAAAVQCQKWGYKLGFHFDPLVYYEDWESGYREAVKEIFKAIDPTGVVWVSLGALRFPPHLLETVKKRFPASRIPYGEFIPGHHGKLRYFRPIREDMYRKMISWIGKEAPQVFVYLCMESSVVWKRSFGSGDWSASFLCDRLDEAVVSG